MIPSLEAGIPSRAVTLTNLTLARHPWLLLCAGQSSLGLCEGTQAAFPRPRAVAISAEVLWRESVAAGEHVCTELAAAARWQADAAASPAPSRLSCCPISPGTRECWECRLFTGDLFNWSNRILIPRARASLSLDVFT